MSTAVDRKLLLFKERFLAQREFWRSALSVPEVATSLGASARGPLAAASAASAEFVLPEAVSAALGRMCRGSDAALYVALLAGLKIVLRRYSGAADVTVVSPPVRDRITVETINDRVFVQSTVEGDDSLRDVLLRVRRAVLDAYANQDYPYDEVLELIGAVGTHALSNVVCSLVELHGADGIAVGAPSTHVAFRRDGASLRGRVTSDDPGAGELLDGLGRHLGSVLQRMTTSIDAPVRETTLLGNEERADVVALSSGPSRPVDDVSVLARIARSAEAHPDAVAISDGLREIRYRDLLARAGRLAAGLRAAGAAPGDLVAVYAERDAELVPLLLAIWWAGAIYLPLDPAEPPLRTRAIVTEAGVRLVVCGSSADTADVTAALGVPAAALPELSREPAAPVPPPSVLDGPAYVIYTSGSTGTPKGATVEHAGMLNHLGAKAELLALSERSVVAQTASQCFDISIWQMLAPLIAGGECRIVSETVIRDAAAFVRLLGESGVTVLEIVPSYLDALVEAWADARERNRLAWLMTTGEALHPAQAAKWFETFPQVPIVNAYGPTEAGDDITHHVFREAPAGRVPIGRAIPNMRVYVVDCFGDVAPLGVAGEIWTAGAGVGPGYRNAPELTAQAFLERDPFAGAPGRLYKTGDIGRYGVDGALEYLGRADHQVKIRGYRIELGEVEAALHALPELERAAVLMQRAADGGNELVAVVQARTETGEDGSAIGRSLAARLPAHMVPARVVFVAAMPTNRNGKTDRRALEAMLAELAHAGAAPAAPSTAVESALVGVWREVLKRDDVGIDSNFFELGGHSVSAIQIAGRISRQLGAVISISEFFRMPTVRELAAVIEERSGISASAAAIVPVEMSEYPLSPVQLPEWYLALLNPNSAFYNIGATVELSGPFDLGAFVKALELLIARHDVFHLAFGSREGVPHFVLTEPGALDLAEVYVDLSGSENADEALAQFVNVTVNRAFDLATAPIATFRLVRLAAERHVFVFETHHIIWDQQSTFVFASELGLAYNAYARGEEPALAPLPIRYADYCAWINAKIASGELDEHRAFWLDTYRHGPEPLRLPTDFPRPAIQTFNGNTLYHHLDPALRGRIEQLCRANETTLQIVLMTALAVYLSRIAHQREFVIGTPITNRTEESFERLVGLFASAVPIKCTVDERESFFANLRRIQAASLEAYDHSPYPFARALEELEAAPDFSRSRVMSVFFGVQNDNTPVDRLSGAFDGLTAKFVVRDGVTESSRGTSIFDFTLQVDHSDRYMYFSLRYNSDLFHEATARQMLDQYARTLEECVGRSGEPIALLDAWSPGAFVEPSTALGATAGHDEPAFVPVHRQIAATAARVPDAVAVRSDGRASTYRDLERRSRFVAGRLAESGVRAGDRVGVCAERGLDLIAAMLGVLRAGAVLLPLDVAAPPARLRAIVAGARPAAILTRSSPQASVIAHEFPELVVAIAPDAGLENGEVPHPLRAEDADVRADDPAYVMYTSGSTGVPKGLEITHGALARIVRSTEEACRLSGGSVLFNTNVAFDSSLLDVMWPLAVGATIVVMPEEFGKDLRAIAEAVESHGVTLMQGVPLLLHSLTEARASGRIGPLAALRTFNCGGAILSAAARDRFLAQFDCALFNNYGPTEAAIDVARFDCREEVQRHVVPIGDGVAGAVLHVLDEALRPCPAGVPGELYIASPSLAAGYVDRPALTAEAFVPNAFGAGDRAYRTGDVAVRDAGGRVTILGRAGNQVQVNGYRVELEDVEHALIGAAGVAKAAVLCEPSGEGDRLIAVAEAEPGTQLEPAALTRHLRKRLPAYMIPHAYVFVDALPVLPSGKPDRRGLAAMAADDRAEAGGPLTETERTMGAIFADVLGRPVTRRAHFFRSGGNSLTLLRLAAKIDDVFGIDVAVRDLLLHPTVAEAAAFVDAHAAASVSEHTDRSRGDEVMVITR